MDGHTGVEQNRLKEWKPANFHLVLSALKDSRGAISLVLHAAPTTTTVGARIQPGKFLLGLGFQPFGGRCQFHARCGWKMVAELDEGYGGDIGRVFGLERIHAGIDAFVTRLPDLLELARQRDRILPEIGEEQGPFPIFNVPVEVKAAPGDRPPWTSDVEFPELQARRRDLAAAEAAVAEIERYLPLVYETGDALEDAVVAALRFLGLEAWKAEKAFTVDVHAKTQDGGQWFGFEVTGLDDSIKKRSNKLTQVEQFEWEKEHDEKVVLLANTHRTTPVADQKDLSDFTSDAIKHLSVRPFLLMTGWQLYQMVGDVLSERLEARRAVAMLEESVGVLVYPP